MIRTQVYLTEEQVQDIKLRARREQRNKAAVIRDLIDRGRQQTHNQSEQSVTKMLARLEQLGLQGPTDLSTQHDGYLYGDKA